MSKFCLSNQTQSLEVKQLCFFVGIVFHYKKNRRLQSSRFYWSSLYVVELLLYGWDDDRSSSAVEFKKREVVELLFKRTQEQ